MATPNPDSPAVLSGEILAEAGHECDEILRRARRAAESLLAAATAEADKIRRETLDAARAEAARRGELILGTVPVEAGRLQAARIEAMLENIREAVRCQIASRRFDAYETVVALAAEALRQMPGTDFVLRLSAVDHAAFGDKLTGEICRRTGRSPLKLAISADPAMTDGGVMVQDADGIRMWDNRLLSRLERLWPELRRQIARRLSPVGKDEPEGGAA